MGDRLHVGEADRPLTGAREHVQPVEHHERRAGRVLGVAHREHGAVVLEPEVQPDHVAVSWVVRLGAVERDARGQVLDRGEPSSAAVQRLRCSRA